MRLSVARTPMYEGMDTRQTHFGGQRGKGNFSKPQNLVIPASAGIHHPIDLRDVRRMGSRVRENDGGL